MDGQRSSTEDEKTFCWKTQFLVLLFVALDKQLRGFLSSRPSSFSPWLNGVSRRTEVAGDQEGGFVEENGPVTVQGPPLEYL